MDFEATKKFYVYRNFEARLSHVDSLVEEVDISEISERWKPISKLVRSHLETRNLIAHQGMARSSGVNDRGEHYYYLWPPMFREGGRPLTVTVVKETADAFEKAYEDLRQLVSFTNRYDR
jgi:pantothenate kinase